MMTIDGGQRSGSGTIVRDGGAFAALTQRPLHLQNIRARRDKPGLRPQHLKALQACAELCRGELRKAHVGSQELVFIPRGPIKGGTYHFDIQTAGSTTMLAQTLLPLGLFADGSCVFILSGGLFQDFAPSAIHMQKALIKALSGMGIRAGVEIIRPGYVPRGGGCLKCWVEPLQRPPRPFTIPDRGRLGAVRGLALSSHLKQRRVSERMSEVCRQRLSQKGLSAEIQEIYDTRQDPAYMEPALQAGACLAVWARTDAGGILGADMAGAPQRPAEEIGRRVADQLCEDLSLQACVDRYLADQLIPFAALASGESLYRIPFPTDHVETRLWLVREFFGAATEVSDQVMRVAGIGELDDRYGR